MPPAVAGIAVRVTSQVGDFVKGMRQSSAAAQGFDRALSGVAGRTLKFGGALAGIAAGAFVALIKRQFSLITALAKTADMLGTTSKELAGLEFAARAVGEPVSTITTGIQRLNRVVFDAATGSKAAQAAFDELGLSVAKLQLSSPIDKLKRIADAFDRVKTTIDQNRLAMKLFGGAGTSMVRILRGGAAALNETTKEARELGLGLSEIDSAKVVIATQAWSKLKAVLAGPGGLFAQIAVELSPILKFAADRFLAWAKVAGGAAGVVARAVGALEFAINKLAGPLEAIKLGWFTFKGVAIIAITGVVGSLGLLVKGLNKVAQLFDVTILEGAVAFFDTLTNDLANEAAAAFESAAESWDKLATGIRQTDFSDFLAGITDELDALAKGMADAAAQRRDLSKAAFAPAAAMAKRGSLRDIAGALTEFRQISLARVAIPGQGRAGRPPVNPQITGTNRLLADILNELKKNVGLG